MNELYSYNWAEHRRETRDLSIVEKGIYYIYIEYIFVNKKKIPFHGRHKILKERLSPSQRIIADKVLDKFFLKEGNSWTHPRVWEIVTNKALKSVAYGLNNQNNAGKTNENSEYKQLKNKMINDITEKYNADKDSLEKYTRELDRLIYFGVPISFSLYNIHEEIDKYFKFRKKIGKSFNKQSFVNFIRKLGGLQRKGKNVKAILTYALEKKKVNPFLEH